MTPEPPKITFPCADYPIKVIGRDTAEFEPFVRAVLARQLPGFDPAGISRNPSRNGQFVSLRVRVALASEAQLVQLFNELKQNPLVQMVL